MRRCGKLARCVVLPFMVSGAMFAWPLDLSVAVGESCHGQPATIVGAAGSELRATDGADVVVTNGAIAVFAGAGNDLVCVTGGADLDDQEVIRILAEDGDDVIDGTTVEADLLYVDLGQGNDAFTGGPEADSVSANLDSFPVLGGAGDDTVFTGAGDDSIDTGGTPGVPDHDTIDLGPGRDRASIQGWVDPALPIRGGEGSDEFDFGRSSLHDALVIDNAAQRATNAGVTVMTWSSFERFRLSPFGPHEPPSFIGGAGSERLQTHIPLTSVDLGGGNDLVNLELRKLVDHASYAGGAGDDDFIFNSGGNQARQVRLDVPKGRLLFRQGKQAVRARISGFERHRLSADRLDIRGAGAADHVQWMGCRGVVDGGPGPDLIEEFSNPDVGCGYLNENAELVVRGGRGDDKLRGSGAPNILIGGAGDDLADGRGSNRDHCVAETEIRCER